MKNALLLLAVSMFLWVSCGENYKVQPVNDGKVFIGKWTYRSLLNDKDVNTDFDLLAFAAATISLERKGRDSLFGQILWPIDSPATQFNGLNLTGYYYNNDTTLCYFLEGFGDSTLGTAGWQYNYQGYLVPRWPEGVDQATVLVGSVVRVKKHSCDSTGQHCHPAGVVASTYMVKD